MTMMKDMFRVLINNRYLIEEYTEVYEKSSETYTEIYDLYRSTVIQLQKSTKNITVRDMNIRKSLKDCEVIIDTDLRFKTATGHVISIIEDRSIAILPDGHGTELRKLTDIYRETYKNALEEVKRMIREHGEKHSVFHNQFHTDMKTHAVIVIMNTPSGLKIVHNGYEYRTVRTDEELHMAIDDLIAEITAELNTNNS